MRPTSTIQLLAVAGCIARRRMAVTAAVIADEVGLSKRTVYRHVNYLRDSGLDIEGGAGIGYAIRPAAMERWLRHHMGLPAADRRSLVDATAAEAGGPAP